MRVSSRKILEWVSDEFKTSPDELKGNGRCRSISLARTVAMSIVYNELFYSLHQTGMIFNRQHSTVYTNMVNLPKRIERYPSLRGKIENVTKRLNEYRNR